MRNRAEGVPIRALPVFIRAAFRHSYIYVYKDSGIAKPKDLEGRRVGTRYDMTATVWARALVTHQYGVRLDRIHWINAAPPPRPPINYPRGMVIDPVEPTVDLREGLAEGKIDALIHPDIVPSKLLARGTVRRLFAEAAVEEKGYFRATQIVPVMNVIAFREDELQQRPETVAAVFAAFCQAKEHGLDAMLDNRHSGLLWYWEALEEQIGLVGDDPVPYSVERMRTTLDAFLTYAVEQGFIPTKLRLSEIFAPGLSF